MKEDHIPSPVNGESRISQRSATPKGAPTYHLTNFSQKLHENEEILAQRGTQGTHAP